MEVKLTNHTKCIIFMCSKSPQSYWFQLDQPPKQLKPKKIKFRNWINHNNRWSNCFILINKCVWSASFIASEITQSLRMLTDMPLSLIVAFHWNKMKEESQCMECQMRQNHIMTGSNWWHNDSMYQDGSLYRSNNTSWSF